MLLPFDTWEHLLNTHTYVIEFLDGDTKLSSCNTIYRLIVCVNLWSALALSDVQAQITLWYGQRNCHLFTDISQTLISLSFFFSALNLELTFFFFTSIVLLFCSKKQQTIIFLACLHCLIAAAFLVKKQKSIIQNYHS